MGHLLNMLCLTVTALAKARLVLYIKSESSFARKEFGSSAAVK